MVAVKLCLATRCLLHDVIGGSGFLSSIRLFIQTLIIATSLLSVQVAPGQVTVLPPELPWNGSSEQLIRSSEDPWVTPAELGGLTETPDYGTTIQWLRRLVEHSPYLTMQSIGQTWQQRNIWLVVASEHGAERPEQLDDPAKATLLFHAGIHSGEIDGKDAGMMFLRDLVLTRPDFLKQINILFIPVLSPDAHENRSAYHRVNQRGPKEMGWRTNARNLNLNRDFSKAETPEIQSLIRLINSWPIDLYIDIHVTDGIDYQYDVTYGFNDKNAYSPNIARWLTSEFRPGIDKALLAAGHAPGPLLISIDNRNLQAGIFHWTAPPRFSNGYGDVCHLPAILVENHSLKSYKQRVLGTYVFLQAVASELAHRKEELREATVTDRALRPEQVPMDWQWDFKNFKPDTIEIAGVDYQTFDSEISGTREVRWLGRPRRFRLPYHVQQARHRVSRPRAYWVPASHTDIIQKLTLHGLQMQIINEPTTVRVELYRLQEPELAKTAFEGRVQLRPGELKVETREHTYMPGSARIATDQTLGDLAIVLLEPYGEDSFLQWGYFHEILQRTEYIEGYAVEPLARVMLKEDPDLKEAFDEALKDESFAGDPDARLQWFYERSPYYDQNYLLYPVGREL